MHQVSIKPFENFHFPADFPPILKAEIEDTDLKYCKLSPAQSKQLLGYHIEGLMAECSENPDKINAICAEFTLFLHTLMAFRARVSDVHDCFDDNTVKLKPLASIHVNVLDPRDKKEDSDWSREWIAELIDPNLKVDTATLLLYIADLKRRIDQALEDGRAVFDPPFFYVDTWQNIGLAHRLVLVQNEYADFLGDFNPAQKAVGAFLLVFMKGDESDLEVVDTFLKHKAWTA